MSRRGSLWVAGASLALAGALSLAPAAGAQPVAVDDRFEAVEDTVLDLSGGGQLTFGFDGGAAGQGVSFEGDWDYLDRLENGLGQGHDYPVDGAGNAWNTPAFDPATSSTGPWGSAPAPLAAGQVDGFPAGSPQVLGGLGEAPNGQNLINTYLFRNTFRAGADDLANPGWAVRVLADDGCVGYLNGEEVFRVNMDPANFDPPGALTPATLVGSPADELTYIEIGVDLAGVLVEGANTLAVELHQATIDSSDAGFDLQLIPGGSGAAEFVYRDDAFGTSRPDLADGVLEPAGGFAGGGLRVRVGGAGGGDDRAASGAWELGFTAPAAGVATVRFRYRLVANTGFEDNEFAEAVAEFDGARLGAGAGGSLIRITGNGNGGPDDDSGWLEASFDLDLAAGEHTLALGAFNNLSTVGSEVADVFFDEVTLLLPGVSASVLDNDTGAPTGAELASGPEHGEVVLAADGSFVYTPGADFNGTDTFTYRALGAGGAAGAPATVTIEVAPLNDAPRPAADAYTVPEDGALRAGPAAAFSGNAYAVIALPATGWDVAQARCAALGGQLAVVESAAEDAFLRGLAGPALGVGRALLIGANDRAEEGVFRWLDGSPLAFDAWLPGQPDNGGGGGGEAFLAYGRDAGGRVGWADAPDGGTVAGFICEWTGSPAFPAGLLDNDADPEGDAFSAELASPPANGVVALAADGAFTYFPAPGFTGVDRFTYRGRDAGAGSPPAEVVVTVTEVEDPPSAVPDLYLVEENRVLRVEEPFALAAQEVFSTDFNAGVPGGFSGAGNLVSVEGFNGRGNLGNVFTGQFLRNAGGGDPQPATTLTLGGLPDHSAVTLSFLLALIDSWNGESGNDSPDRFNVAVDGQVVFSHTFDTADAADGSYTPPPGGLVVDGEALGFDPGAGGNQALFVESAYDLSLEPTLVDIPHTASTLTVEWYASGGGWSGGTNESWAIDNLSVTLRSDTLTLVPNGATWRYFDGAGDPGAGWAGPGFDDGGWSEGEAQLGYGDGDEATEISFGGDDANKHRAAFFRHRFNVESPRLLSGLDLDLLRDDGAAVYLNGTEVARDNLDPGAAFDAEATATVGGNEESEFIRFAVDPGLLLEGENVLAVEVHQANGTSSDLSFDLRLQGETARRVGVLANDVDPEGAPLTAELVEGPEHGVLEFNPDGTFVYTPEVNYFGTDRFVYRASDGVLSAVGVATIVVTPGPNDLPLATGDSYAAVEDEVLTVAAGPGLLANDSDPNDDMLRAVPEDTPAHGEVAIEPDGSFVYTPALDFAGEDTFTYRAFDGIDHSAPATVTLAVENRNDPPVAVEDRFFVEPGEELQVSAVAGVLANDIDVDGDDLAADLVNGPVRGAFELLPSGGLSYTPGAGVTSGVDIFRYRASDGTAFSGVALGAIFINDLPRAGADAYAATEDVPLSVPAGGGVLANDTDSSALTAAVVLPPAKGQLVLNADGSFRYTPDPDFFGEDSFTYRSHDGLQGSAETVVTLTVAAVNDRPEARDDRYVLTEDREISIPGGRGLLANDRDVDGDALAAEITTPPAQGELAVAPDGSFTYRPPAGFTGAVTFAYAALDGELGSLPATVTLEIEPASKLVHINEIMFHPAPVDGREPLGEEFIELASAADFPIQLAGWRFTAGVSFTFPQVEIPPRGFVVVAASTLGFAARYPGADFDRVVGGWEGQLSNSGERIRLRDAAGVEVDEVSYADQGDWAVRRRGPDDRGHNGWVWEAPHDGGGASLELANPALGNRKGQNWRPGLDGGTPGSPNAAASEDVAPLITGVEHRPAVPRPGQPVVVRADLEDEVDGGADAPTATLYYRRADPSPGAFTAVEMRDDGLSGDGGAGDGRHAGRLPGFPDGTVVEFYVEASDSGGQTRTYPGPSDVDGAQGANCLYQVDSEVRRGPEPLYRIVLSGEEAAEFNGINRQSNAQMNVTFIAVTATGTDVRYNAGLRVRGAGSRGRTPVGVRVNLPRDRPWNGDVRLNLNTQFTWLQLVGSRYLQAAGLVAADATLARVRFNGRDLAGAGSPQYGYYVHMEPVDAVFVDAHFPADPGGNLYIKRRPDVKWRFRDGDAGDYRSDGWSKGNHTSADDWGDLDNFMRVINSASGPTYLEQVGAVADVGQWVRWFAATALLNDRETNLSNGTDDDYDVYIGTDGRLLLIPHDLDTILGMGDTGTNPDASIFPAIDTGFGGQSMPQLVPFFRHPEISRRYYAELRAQIAGPFSAARLDPMLDHALAGRVPRGVIDNMKAFAAARRAHVLSQIPGGLTVGHNLVEVDGYGRTDDPGAVDFSGRFDPAVTARVLLGGEEVSFDPFTGRWTGTAPTQGAIVPFGSSWKYLDDGSDQGTDWRVPDFDDANWFEGPGQLGYGDGDETTTVGFGPDDNEKYATTYFRHTFEVADPEVVDALTLRVTYDDAVAVYLNGTEILRTPNLPPDAAFDTYADDDADETITLAVPAVAIVAGANTLAAEVHQGDGGSSDISFDLQLEGGDLVSPLRPGVNRVTALALDADGREVGRAGVDVWYEDGNVNEVGGTIDADTTWQADAGPYLVTTDVTVPAGVTLTIAPGTTVFFDGGVGMTIRGRLVAAGEEHARIRLTRLPGSGVAWDGLRFVESDAPSWLARLDQDFGDGAGHSIEVDRARLTLEDVTWGGTGRTVLELDHPKLLARSCTFPPADGEEIIHGSGLEGEEFFVLEGNRFGGTLGYNDIIDFSGARRPGPVVEVYDNTFLGASDDILDLDGADAHIEGNRFFNVHVDGDRPSTANAIAADDGSALTVVRNVFSDVDHALLLKGGSTAVFAHNVVSGASVAAVSFDEPGRGAGPGAGIVIEGCIFHDIAATFAHLGSLAGPGAVVVRSSIIPVEEHGRGSRNIDEDPRLVDPGGGDFRLRPGSPALGTGPVGLDRGAEVPPGAAVTGEPPEVTASAQALLLVGGPGITQYRYSVNGGAFSAARPTAVPLFLNGLSGEVRLRVIGMNSAGVWQAEDEATEALPWIVDPGFSLVRINEVLADNAGGALGTTADLVELFNPGRAAVDLGGMGLSDDVANPHAFTFPPGTVLGGGEYLVLAGGDGAAGSGLPDLGFGIDADGEAVFLHAAPGDGGGRLDTVAFGAQLPGRSVGRVGRAGRWALTVPTFGRTNAAARTGDPARVRINEWFTRGAITLRDDFIELYNGDPLPVDLGGLHLTDDTVNAPAKHRIHPLTFVGGGGYRVFLTDGDAAAGPDHLGFRLSAFIGAIGLMGPAAGGGVPPVLDRVAYAAQIEDVSEGRTPDGGDAVTTFPIPTPGFSGAVPSNELAVLAGMRVTEIMYHPAGEGGEAEFIELQNAGPETVNLAGLRLADGVDFTFGQRFLAPGEFVVLVADEAAFRSVYGDGIAVAGTYEGRLANGGERVRLEGSLGIGVLDFSFRDGWYPSTDGGGHSLVVIDTAAPRASWDEAENWTPSALVGGSPGVVDAPIVVGAGADRTIALPANTVTLSATVNLGAVDPAALVTTWSVAEGPGAAFVGAPGSLQTAVTFAAPGRYVLRLVATDGVLAGQDELVVVVGDSIESWRSRRFTIAELAQPTVSGDGADPDRDGLENLLEFALGLDPKVDDRARRPIAVALEGGGLAFTFSLAYTAATEVEITVEVADDPRGPWHSGPDVVELLPAGASPRFETFRARDRGGDGAPGRFMRLRVQSRP